MAHIESIQVGRVTPYASTDEAKSWTSAIDKRPVPGPVRVKLLGLEGDQQADLVHHGGADKAVLAYAAAHYPWWRAEFPGVELVAGAFGENITVAGLDEASCCVGDIFRVGNCVLQVSQPRQPCWKLGRRWQLAKLPVVVQSTGRTGWYLRVLEAGEVAAGMRLERIDRPHPEFSVQWANSVMYAKPRRPEDDRLLAACPTLAAAWREHFARRTHQPEGGSEG